MSEHLPQDDGPFHPTFRSQIRRLAGTATHALQKRDLCMRHDQADILGLRCYTPTAREPENPPCRISSAAIPFLSMIRAGFPDPEVGAWNAREFGIDDQTRFGLIALLHRLDMEHRKPFRAIWTRRNKRLSSRATRP